MYKMLLMRYHCSIIDARNGQEGLHKLAWNPDIDLVLLDINMPLVSSFEFITAVKEEEQYSHIPIIMAGSPNSVEDARKGLALGAQGYLKKPFASSEMHAIIEKLYPTPVHAACA